MESAMIFSSTTRRSFDLPKTYNQFRSIQRILTNLSIPYRFFIATLGLFTNATTIVLLSRSLITKTLRNKWTLIALAMSDLLFNISLLIHATHDLFAMKSARLCLFISFLSHFAELLSAQYTVSFTIQRFTAVYNPFQSVSQKDLSPFISLGLIFVFSCLFCTALVYQADYSSCHEDLNVYWFIADALVSFFIPFLLITIFNILIVSLIRKNSRSSITVQAILLRRKSPRNQRFRSAQLDETLTTDNNTIVNGLNFSIHQNEFVPSQMKSKRTIQVNGERNIQTNSVSSNFDQINIEQNQVGRSPKAIVNKLFKWNFSRSVRRLSSDSFLSHSTRKSSISPNHERDSARSRSARTSQSIRVTRMLVLVSTCFLLLNAPAHFFIILTKFYTMNAETQSNQNEFPFLLNKNNSTLDFVTTSNETSTWIQTSFSHVNDQLEVHLLFVAVVLTQFISYASYSINFFLYSLSGITFRTSLRQLFRRLRKY